IEQQPADITACLNEAPLLEVRASGGYPEPEYRWESSPGPGGPWTALESADGPGLRPSAAAAGEYYYRCMLSTAAPGCAPLATTPAKLTVLPQVVTLQLPVKGICAGAGPVPLSGGLPERLAADQTGIYSGEGVINGRFDPAAAGGPGKYEIHYTLSNTSGCQYLASDTIEVYPAAFAEAGPDKKILQGTYTIVEGSGEGTAFSWTPAEGLDQPGSLSPRASPAETTTYILTARTAEGCTATDSVKVEVLEKPVIPNAFTPNSDGVNDTWEIGGIGDYPGVIIKIYNRWGTEVYATRGYSVPWDGRSAGKALPSGPYYYVLIPGAFLGPVFGIITIIR
ncbi:MAG TPA: gliding motility-associated C-terminal domain-containing protein, partial [Anseongella sp.]|nr:gliding motility-associated C-terminal domain-containing protein [Anseongella sp.]